MTTFIEDYRIDHLNCGESGQCDSMPAWLAGDVVSAGPGPAARASARAVRTGIDRSRTPVRTPGRPADGRPGGSGAGSRRPNTWSVPFDSAVGGNVSNTRGRIARGVRGGHARVRGPVQGVRRNAASMAIVVGVGAVFGMMLHFSGLGAPEPEAPPAPTYVGASADAPR